MQFSDLWNLLKTTATIWGPFVSGLIAGLIAAFVVHLLTQSRERERWILDCQKEEFKELLTAIAESYLPTLRTVGQSFSALDEQDQRQLSTVTANAFRCFQDRLYIVDHLNLNELSNAWILALSSRNIDLLQTEYKRISETIVVAANKAVPKFWKR